MSTRASTLSLYRRIITAARNFPSIKRNSIVQEIRMGFRDNAGLNPEEASDEYRTAMKLAIQGLTQLEQYSNLPKRSTSWSVSMDNNPMPKPEPKEGVTIIDEGEVANSK